MKPMPMIIALVLSFFSMQVLQGCKGSNKVYQLTVTFPNPVEASKGATKTLWIYYIIPSGDNATCQDLMSGVRNPGDNGYQVEYTEGIPNPFTKKVPALRVEDTITRLFFLEGKDAEDQTILRGCNTSGNGTQDTTITLAIVCPSDKADCDGDFSTGCEEDITTTAHCGNCRDACTNDHGQTACLASVCIPTCDSGFSDCDGNLNNGCETDINTPSGCNGYGTCLFSNNMPTCECSAGYDGDRCERCASGTLGTYPNCGRCGNRYFGTFPDCFLPSSSYCLTSQCFAVPPTGQKDCYDDVDRMISCPGGVGNSLDCDTGSPAFCGQDSQYAKVVKDETLKCYNGANDIPCTGSANTDDVVIDSATGLMWQRKIPNLETDTKTWLNAKNYCEQVLNSGQGYAGHTDWRLPNPFELHSIMDLSKYNIADSNPLINISVFPDTPSSTLSDCNTLAESDWFWTSSSDVADPDNFAWAVNFIHYDFAYKVVYSCDKTISCYVRCVRGGPIPTETSDGSRFITSPGSPPVITDLVTGLIWQLGDTTTACPTDSVCTVAPCPCTWENALKSCENSDYAGYPDWRLPNVNELMSLINYNHDPSDPATYFPGKPHDKFWSSSCAAPAPTHVPFALIVYFQNGLVLDDGQNSTLRVRCVRNGP